MASPVALITGASSGIGYELARIFAKNGINLVLVARSVSKLEELADELRSKHNVSVRVISKDLTDPGAPQEIYDALQKEGIVVEYLVNNAGFGDHNMFVHSDWNKDHHMLQVNITALTHLTHLLLPRMLERGKGRILNVASTASFQPGPTMAVYYATKAYVLFLSEALYNELYGTGVTVTCLCPGPTASGFQEVAGLHRSRIVRARKLPTSREVALFGYRAMMQGKMTVVHGLMNRLLVFGVRFTPRRLALRIVRWIQE